MVKGFDSDNNNLKFITVECDDSPDKLEYYSSYVRVGEFVDVLTGIKTKYGDLAVKCIYDDGEESEVALDVKSLGAELVDDRGCFGTVHFLNDKYCKTLSMVSDVIEFLNNALEDDETLPSYKGTSYKVTRDRELSFAGESYRTSGGDLKYIFIGQDTIFLLMKPNSYNESNTVNTDEDLWYWFMGNFKYEGFWNNTHEYHFIAVDVG